MVTHFNASWGTGCNPGYHLVHHVSNYHVHYLQCNKRSLYLMILNFSPKVAIFIIHPYLVAWQFFYWVTSACCKTLNCTSQLLNNIYIYQLWKHLHGPWNATDILSINELISCAWIKLYQKSGLYIFTLSQNIYQYWYLDNNYGHKLQIISKELQMYAFYSIIFFWHFSNS